MFQPCLVHRAARDQGGLTVLELLVVTAVAGITLTLAVPSMERLYHSNAMTTQLNHLVRHLNMARSEAVKRRRRVALCPSESATACLADPHWHRGWTMFVDDNGNREIDHGEEVLRRVDRADAGITVTSSRYRRRVVYQPGGALHGDNATYTFCDPAGAVEPRAVIVSNSGRARVARHKPDGKALDCR